MNKKIKHHEDGLDFTVSTKGVQLDIESLSKSKKVKEQMKAAKALINRQTK